MRPWEAENARRRAVENRLFTVAYAGMGLGFLLASRTITGGYAAILAGRDVGGVAMVLGALSLIRAAFVFGQRTPPPWDSVSAPRTAR